MLVMMVCCHIGMKCLQSGSCNPPFCHTTLCSEWRMGDVREKYPNMKYSIYLYCFVFLSFQAMGQVVMLRSTITRSSRSWWRMDRSTFQTQTLSPMTMWTYHISWWETMPSAWPRTWWNPMVRGIYPGSRGSWTTDCPGLVVSLRMHLELLATDSRS